VIVDSSAVLAVIFGEADAARFADALACAEACRMAAPVWFEASMVVEGRGGLAAVQRLDDFMAEAVVELVSFSPEHARLAQQAWRRFGRGRHRAGLNYGDCMSYALARERREPLLFKGDDFVHTDIEPALKD
jgi:ribonuclease VapC